MRWPARKESKERQQERQSMNNEEQLASMSDI